MKRPKVLFICRANVGRSQAAMELYRQQGGLADSAGTCVQEPGQILADRTGAENIIRTMREDHDIDMSRNARTQLSPEIAAGYEKLIVMAEPEVIPPWLLADERAEFWAVDDPKGKTITETKWIVDEIKHRTEAIQTTF